MKLLVFSDSHGVVMYMESAVRAHRPDMVLHLGDCVEDFQALRALFPDLPMDHVPGNCDYGADGPATKLLTLSGARIFMTHGHRYGVKSGYLRAIYAAREQQADLLLFGHTHYAECFQEGPLWCSTPRCPERKLWNHHPEPGRHGMLPGPPGRKGTLRCC